MKEDEFKGSSHFKRTSSKHDAFVRANSKRIYDGEIDQNSKKLLEEAKSGGLKLAEHDYFFPMVNTVWTREELDEKCRQNQPVHTPVTWTDSAMRFLVKKVLYRGFNWASGYNYDDPTPKSCAYRIILLESIAGVPGMVAGIIRHFASLRTLRRDKGWIHSLLEEAQNERMHLLVAMKMFDAGILTRFSVIVAQNVVVVFLTALYIVHPTALHRFVGYLEETAVVTYSGLIDKVKTPGTRLNKAWAHLKAPQIAKAYWNMPDDSTWLDTLEQICADETHHRDVNHTLAELDAEDPNPFVDQTIANYESLVQRDLGKWKKTGIEGAR